ncbi:hypothetical protein EMPS_06515 [Entomortierella parvispora]|uniref:6-phosphogluconate dehydrogenase NADP-binding domain-containing protein n=1 Tax=Entomortierella parvispora TaxID=205924 RepID=A0A9P3HCK9_9FUNG|nr:hypothetical protein EMPS_06515 [Entomortierella parvispora]
MASTSSHSDIQIGWVGLGEMGSGMAHNLQKHLASQSRHLTVWNRSPGKSSEIEALGAQVAPSLEALFLKNQVIFTSLANDAAVENVYGQLFALAQNATHPMIFIDTSTVYPTIPRKLSQALSEIQGGRHAFLQCPVFGRPPAAHAAQLIWLTSGNAEAIEKLRPYFAAMSKSIIDLKTEDVGQASQFKLMGNFFVVGTIELLAEGLTFAEKSNMDQGAVLKFIETFFPTPSWITYSQKMADRSATKAGGFPVTLGLKDVGHMNTLAKENGTTLPTAELAYKHLEIMKERGAGDHDWSTMIDVLRNPPQGKL